MSHFSGTTIDGFRTLRKREIRRQELLPLVTEQFNQWCKAGRPTDWAPSYRHLDRRDRILAQRIWQELFEGEL